jgi:cell division protein ZapD
MAKPATEIGNESAREGPAHYEQPVSERMRTFLRLEFLYQQLLYNLELDNGWATRATVAGLLEIAAILSRGDVRSEVHKELDHQLSVLQRFQSQPEVDSARLDSLVRNLLESRAQVDAIGTSFLQPIKESDFLHAIKNRSTIPGGTCEFDLPEYNHWLRQPYARRQEDLDRWIEALRPLLDAVLEILWLVRESAQPLRKTAANGMYQHSLAKDSPCRLIRVLVPGNQALYPEISGNQYRFTVRFLEWSTTDRRAVQTPNDVSFLLSIC